jgi:3-ketosteroid 9alpha-monooxygenase subunit A
LPTHFKNIFEGQVATQYMSSAGRPDLGGTEGARMLGTTSVASYYGPSFMVDDLTYHYEEADHKTVLINCHYPIDANSFVLQYGIIVKKSAALPEELAMQTAIALGDFVKTGFEQDVAIWKNKARIDNPLLCEEDGPVYQLRRWYEQFYVDVADVTPDMVDRFEHELDTTSPRDEWMKVIEANLARTPVAATIR